MRLFSLLIFVSLFSLSAHATNNHSNQPEGGDATAVAGAAAEGGDATAGALSIAGADADASAHAGASSSVRADFSQGQEQDQIQVQDQLQDQDQVQGQGQEQSASAVNAGNQQSITISENEEHPNNIKLRNTPAPYAPTVPATSPCMTSATGGLSLPGFGLSGGKTTLDNECNLRQTAISAWNAGIVEVGDVVFCHTKAIADTIGKEQCISLVSQERAARVAALATKEDVASAEARVVERLNRRDEQLGK